MAKIKRKCGTHLKVLAALLEVHFIGFAPSTADFRDGHHCG